MTTTATKPRITSSVAPRARRGFVTITQSEYFRLCLEAAPVVQLKGRAAKALDKSVDNAMREHAEGKTVLIRSLADLD